MELLLFFVLGLVSQEYAFGTKLSCSPEGAVELQGSGAKSVITCTCDVGANHDVNWRVSHGGDHVTVGTCLSDGICSSYQHGFNASKTSDGLCTLTMDGSKVDDRFRGQNVTLQVGLQTVVFQIDVIYGPKDMYMRIDNSTVLTVNEGERVTFDCQAHGQPPPDLFLARAENAHELKREDGRDELNGTSRLTHQMTVQFSSAGVYVCRASNSLDTDTETSARLIVNCKPRLKTRKSRDLRVINYVDGPLFLDFCFDASPEPTASPVTYDGSRKTDTSARVTFMTVCSNLSVAGCSVICKVIVNDVANKSGEGIYTFHVQNSLGREDVRFRVETSGASKTTSTWSIVGGVLSVIAVAVIVCFLIYLVIAKKRHKHRRATRSRRDTDSTSGSAITATTRAPSPRHSAILQGFPPEFERNESLARSSGLRRAHSVSVISRSMHEQVWSSDRPYVVRNSRAPPDYHSTATLPYAASVDDETLSVFNFSTGSLLATEAHQTHPKAVYPRLPSNINETRTPAASNNPSGHYDSIEPYETVPKTVASRQPSTSSVDDIDDKEVNGSHGNIDNLWVGNFSDYGSSDSLETRPKYVYSSQTLAKGSNG